MKIKEICLHKAQIICISVIYHNGLPPANKLNPINKSSLYKRRIAYNMTINALNINDS